MSDQKIATNIKIEAINSLNSSDTETNNTVLCENLLKSINEAAVNCLPIKEKSKLYQLWHNDEKLKHLYELKDRYILENYNLNSLRAIRKKIRLRARYLKNEYLKQEAEKINQLAINRELEKLFHRAKSQNTIFKPVSNSCAPQKLLEHFKSHFNPPDPS